MLGMRNKVARQSSPLHKDEEWAHTVCMRGDKPKQQEKKKKKAVKK
jgi:hypothetical protein